MSIKKTNVIDKKEKVIANDTIEVYENTAIFFTSTQEQTEMKRNELGENDFHIGVDDYLFYMNQASIFLSRKSIKIIEIKKSVILSFKISENNFKIIKTDTLSDLMGVIFFKQSKVPKIVDILNLEE